MRVLLTGGTGFLGSHLVKALIDQDYDITIIKRSFSNINKISQYEKTLTFIDIDKIDLEKHAETESYDIIIHCATSYGRNDNNPLNVIDANLQLPLRLLALSGKMNVTAFINTDTILDKRINYYSLSKSQFVEWMNFYSHDFSCINISLEHFFGPEDEPSKFISYIIESLLDDKDEILLTEGKQKRDFIYISDVINAFITIINRIKDFGTGIHNFEVGSGQLISIRDLVCLIKDLSGNTKTELKFGAIPYRENEVMNSHVNLENINNIGWTSSVPLVEGLKETLKIEKERRIENTN